MSGAKKDISKGISGLLLIILVLLLGLSLCSQWLPAFDTALTLLIYLIVYIIPMAVYLRRRRYKMRSALRLKFVKPRYWLFLLLFSLSVCILCSLINLGSSALFRNVFHLSFRDGIVDLSGTGAGTLMMTSVLLPAFSEELLLRGLVQGEYEKYGKTIGILLTALIFALFHTNPVQIPSLFVAGVCYGVLTNLFQSVWPAVFAHAVNNGIAVFLTRENELVRYLMQDRLFMIMAIVACFLILIFTLKMLERVINELGKNARTKGGNRALAYGDPLLSPWLWLFFALCVGKIIYNFFI